MSVFTKPKEFLTNSEYRDRLPDIPFSRDGREYMDDLAIFEAALRKWQAAWWDYVEMRVHRMDEDPADIKAARETFDDLTLLMEELEKSICERWGIDGRELKRDADLLRDKRQIGVI